MRKYFILDEYSNPLLNIVKIDGKLEISTECALTRTTVEEYFKLSAEDKLQLTQFGICIANSKGDTFRGILMDIKYIGIFKKSTHETVQSLYSTLIVQATRGNNNSDEVNLSTYNDLFLCMRTIKPGYISQILSTLYIGTAKALANAIESLLFLEKAMKITSISTYCVTDDAIWKYSRIDILFNIVSKFSIERLGYDIAKGFETEDSKTQEFINLK